MATDITNPFLDDEDELDSRLVDDEQAAENDVEATTERRPWERDYTAEERADMAARRAAGELLPGHKRASTYRRRDITDRDLQLLAFIARFKYATEAQLAMLSNVLPKTAYKRMMGLRELGMAACEHVPGGEPRVVRHGQGVAVARGGSLHQPRRRGGGLKRRSRVTRAHPRGQPNGALAHAWVPRGGQLLIASDAVLPGLARQRVHDSQCVGRVEGLTDGRREEVR